MAQRLAPNEVPLARGSFHSRDAVDHLGAGIDGSSQQYLNVIIRQFIIVVTWSDP